MTGSPVGRPRRTWLAALSAILLIGLLQGIYQLLAAPVLDLMAQSLHGGLLPGLLAIAVNGAAAFGGLSLIHRWFPHASRGVVLASVMALAVFTAALAVIEGFTSGAWAQAAHQVGTVLAMALGGKIAQALDEERIAI